MDIAFSFYLTKKLEIKEKEASRELKEKIYKEKNMYLEICDNCGQPKYWCQCLNKSNSLSKGS